MRPTRTLKDLRSCKRGNALIMVAATAPLLIAASAIGLDTIQVTVAKRQLQRSADSAAMAGASARAQKQTSAAAVAAVDRDLTHNNNMTLTTPRVIENAPTTGTYAGDQRAVRVVLKATRSVPFISFFTGSSMDIEVEATAAAVPDGIYCVVSLESTSATGVTFAGNSAVNLGCGVATNSTGTSAISVNGNPNVTASPIAARGGVPAASNFLGTTTVIPNSPVQADPFASLANPTLPATCANKTVVDTGKNDPFREIEPGCYRGLELKGNVTLKPGTYYIDGDQLSFGSSANVQGNGVTFVLTSSNIVSNPASAAELKMNAQASVRLTAPTTVSGQPYPGVIIYQDRRASNTDASADGETDASKADTYHINGGSNSWLDGAIYMPKSNVTFNGGSGLDVRCLRLVTRQIKFSGNTTLTNNCPTNDPRRGYTGFVIRLVG
jgi:Flp pilus assembly protein TadG